MRGRFFDCSTSNCGFKSLIGWVSKSVSLGPEIDFTADNGPVIKLTYIYAKRIGFPQLVETFGCVDMHLSLGRNDVHAVDETIKLVLQKGHVPLDKILSKHDQT
jgi:hypothetical protein